MDSHSNKNIMSTKNKPHAIFFPMPFQGHINPMFKLAKLLHLKGFSITFVHTEHNLQRLLKSSASGSHHDSLSDFRYESISDGLPPDHPRGVLNLQDICMTMPVHTPKALRELVKRVAESPGVPPVTCIVADGVTSFFTLDVAEELGIPEWLFFTPSGCGMLGYFQFEELLKKGLFPLKDKCCLTNGYLDTSIYWIPEWSGVKLKHLPTFIRTTDPSDIMFNINQKAIKHAWKSQGLILNTFEDLEGEALYMIKSHHKLPPVHTVGPMSLLLSTQSQHQDQHQLNRVVDSVESSLWEEDIECLSWLDKQSPGSVVYVNYGSLTIITPTQLNEFAWGLANSKYPFLWVIRPGMIDGAGGDIISKEIMDEVKGRCFISGWCPQERVLKHLSVGVFLTHCGWNSVLEAIGEGVPLICWPFFAEQQMNCFYLCHRWGIGVEMDDDVTRERVEKLVREVMAGEKGKEMSEKMPSIGEQRQLTPYRL